MADDDTDLDLDDLPDPGGDPGAAGRGPGGPAGGDGGGRRWLWLLLGAALGVAGSLLVPRYVAPHLPAALGGGLVTVEGEVLDKQRESGRLLLTLDSDRGAMLATFRERISEFDLLIERGDSVTLAMTEFRPFVDGPRLVGVKKGDWAGRVPATPEDGTAAPDTVAADTAGPADRGPSGPDRPDADTVPGSGGDDGGTPGDAAPDTAGGGAPLHGV